MEAGLAAGYAAETVAEGAVGAGVALAKSTMPLRASWSHISTGISLPRSSHSLAVVRGVAYVFGGEEKPRVAVDNDMHMITLPLSGADADYKRIPASSRTEGEEVPSARLGHTANAINERIYVFGGRGGEEMQPLAENGRVWVFDTMAAKWSYLDPAEGSPYPEPRSYHASAATAHPLHTSHDQLESQFDPLPVDTSSHGTIFVHGGCPAKGRLGDLWAFDIASKIWSLYPDPPGPARGGSCLTYALNRLYRYGGFDGRTNWEVKLTILIWPSAVELEEKPCRMEASERNPSSSGHDAAGQFWDSVWSFQLRSESMTAANLKDATRHLLRAKTGESEWAQVHIPESSKQAGQLLGPGSRGWFASARGYDIGAENVMLWGGVRANNERADDGWLLTVEG